MVHANVLFVGPIKSSMLYFHAQRMISRVYLLVFWCGRYYNTDDFQDICAYDKSVFCLRERHGLLVSDECII